ncbi:MAG: hydrolase [Bacilli bacterium]|jgi:nicotinamidase-related amidase|nr:hydrolase [Bacilli bacterium]
MSSINPIRNQEQDWLLTPKNCGLVVIDYQPTQIHSVNSMETSKLIKNISIVAQAAKIYHLPIVLSTVNVRTTRNQETIEPLKSILKDLPSYDRTSINAWEDQETYDAIKQMKRDKLVMCALWTEACLTYPALDALQEGYEVYAIVDAVGGTTNLAHETALRRLEQAGVKLISIAQFICELQRDWNRQDSVEEFLDIMFELGAFVGQ